MGSSRNGNQLVPAQSGKPKWNHVQCQVDFIASQLPDTHQQIITLLANGHSPFKTSKLTGIDTDVIRLIRDTHPETVERLKAHLAANLAEAAQALSERLIDKAHTMRIENVAKALAIAVDKHQLLSGGVTARTEHRTVPTPEELQAMFDSLPRANATVIEDKDNGNMRHAGS
jgi:hypothetical protein